jgi:hypothetical protein
MLDTIIAVAGLAIGYAAAIYSWPWLRTHVTGAVAEIDALRARAKILEDKIWGAL